MSRLLAGDVGFVMGPVVEALDAAHQAGDKRSESWCRLIIGHCPPFWPAHLRLAYELAVEVGSPMLGALASAFLSIGGTEADDEALLRQMTSNSSKLANQSLEAVCAVTRSAHLIELGELDAARDLAWSVAVNAQVMPGLRLIAIGHVLEVAFIRADADTGRDDHGHAPGAGAVVATRRLAVVRRQRPAAALAAWGAAAYLGNEQPALDGSPRDNAAR